MKLFVLLCCVATVAADLKSLSSEKILDLLGNWNLADAFASDFEAKRYDGSALHSMTMGDLAAEFPNSSPVHRRALHSRIQDMKNGISGRRLTVSKTDPERYKGLTIKKDKSFFTLGSNEDIRFYREDNDNGGGLLNVDASAVDFRVPRIFLTVNGEPLAPPPAEDVNECLTNNGGCHVARRCHNTVGSNECAECARGYIDDGHKGCKDIDECLEYETELRWIVNGDCDPKRKCINMDGSMRCGDCPDGYTNDGDKGCKDIDECAKKNGGCHEQRQCINMPGTNKCGDCPTKFWRNIGDKDCEELNVVFDGEAVIPMEWMEDSGKDKLGKLLYKASKDGWDSHSNWHPKVDDQGPTLTVVKSPEGYIFGGYTSQSWRDYGGNYRNDNHAWLFWIKCRAGLEPGRLKVKMDGNQGHAIFPYNSYGPTWGSGHDIYFTQDMHYGYVHIGHSYPNPSGYENDFLTGVGGSSQHHMAQDIEVYQVL